jgi:hypothetical protein
VAVKTLYPDGGNQGTAGFFGTMVEGTAPGTGNQSLTKPGTTALSSPFHRCRLTSTGAPNTDASASSFIDSTSGPTAGTADSASAAGDSLVIGPFSGTFAATSWTLSWVLRCVSAVGSRGRMRTRVWKGPNADGSGATALTASTQVGATININATGTDFTSSATWNPGTTITLANEYLFFQLEWNETTLGTNASGDVRLRSGTSAVTTPDFTAGANSNVTITDSAAAVAFAGASVVTQPFSSAGVAALAGVGRSTAAATFSMAGTTGGSLVGSYIQGAVLAASGTGAFNPVGAAVKSAVFSMSGAGGFGAGSIGTISGAASISGSGTAAWNAPNVNTGVAVFSGAGAFAPKAPTVVPGSFVMSGAGAFTGLINSLGTGTPAWAGTSDMVMVGNAFVTLTGETTPFPTEPIPIELTVPDGIVDERHVGPLGLNEIIGVAPVGGVVPKNPWRL